MDRDFSKDIIRFIEASPEFQEWSDSRHLLLGMLAVDKAWMHALPVLTCQAVGGEPSTAIPVAAAWMTLVHSANLIDDIQDDDLGRLHQALRPDVALSMAISWVFVAFRMLDHPDLSLETRSRITTLFASAGFDSAMGQMLEFTPAKSEPSDSLQAYWKALILKSGSILMAGAAAGAAIATDSPSLIEAAGDFGRALGIIRQVIDDCMDLQIDTRKNENRRTLPMILQAMVVNPSTESQRHLKTKNRLSRSQIQGNTSEKLVQTGIPEIIADILLEWRRRAMDSLYVFEPSEARDALENILATILIPKQQTI
jgi:geranylgeranyl pyrophosphate synthase